MDETPRKKPFTEHYPKWDAPSFDPTKHHLVPKKPGATTNRSVMSRIYEAVTESFSEIRQQTLRKQLGEPEPGTTQTAGSNG